MTLSQFLNELTSREDRVPFIPNMDRENPPSFPEGTIVPVTEEVYWYYLELLPPRWMRSSDFVFVDGAGKILYFWELGRGTEKKYFGLQLSEEESQTFYELARIRQHV